MKITEFAIFGMICLASVSCHGKRAVEKAPQSVDTVRAERGRISQTVILTGSIEAEDFAEIYPRAPGKVIKKLLSEGDSVKKDQPIMLTLQDEVGYTFKPAPVVSKINGFVGRINVDVGGTVSPSIPVATVVNPRTMRVKVDVPEIYLPLMKVGTKIDFMTETLPGDRFTAEVVSISKAIDVRSRASRVELSLPNDDNKLIHGMFAKLDVPMITHEDAVIVPVSTVSWEGDKKFVFKVEDGRAVKTRVDIGIRNDSSLEIISGVEEGDTLVDGGLIELSDGEPVTVNTGPKKEKAAEEE